MPDRDKKETRQKPKTGLVLSGGMLKGAYQIGALRNIRERFAGLPFSFISAASIGALNSYAFLTDRLDMAEQLWQESAAHHSELTRLVKSSYIDEVINAIYKPGNLPSDFYVPLFNSGRHSLEYVLMNGLESEEIRLGLKAGVSLPPFQSGVRLRGESYYDGALIDNIPVGPLLEKELDYIICIYFDNRNYIFENVEFDKKVIKLNFSGDSFIKSSFWADTGEIREMMNIGYEKADMLLEKVFRKGVDDVSYIIEKNIWLNKAYSGEKTRLSGDVVVNRLNKVARKFVKMGTVQTRRKE